jgi:hypothetical protein
MDTRSSMMLRLTSTDTMPSDSWGMQPVSMATFLYAVSSCSTRSAASTAVWLIIWSTVAIVLR